MTLSDLVVSNEDGSALADDDILEGLTLNVVAMEAEESLRTIYDMGAAFGGESATDRMKDLTECMTFKRPDTAKLSRDMLENLARSNRRVTGNVGTEMANQNG